MIHASSYSISMSTPCDNTNRDAPCGTATTTNPPTTGCTANAAGASSASTDYLEFEKFHKLLMSNAPEGFVPWYFPVEAKGKNPDGIAIYKRAGKISSCCNSEWVKVQRGTITRTVCEKCGQGWGSWKAPHARLSFDEVVERLKQRGNIGIASRDGQPLVIYDRDAVHVKDKVFTLTDKSRSRIGGHSYCWRNKDDESLNTNITPNEGEVRSCDQFVVAPGSYVPVGENEEHVDDGFVGRYTVENETSPVTITFNDLPNVFLEHVKKAEENMKRIASLPKRTIKPTGKHSVLFDLKIEDVVGVNSSSDRFAHPLHGSPKTNANFSVSDNLAHCWRHLVSLNPLQFLTVKAGYLNCEEAGSGHKKSKAGASNVIGDDGAIFWAWRQAKLDGIIPQDDPVPVRALKYIATKHGLIKKIENDKPLPKNVYANTLRIIKEEY